ncbi:MAG: hypothetical protein U5K74_02455 [Gemmatimonadaceae bacterium]|nr:hypothetical protein [Gemmatimonadaceae bacterium]
MRVVHRMIVARGILRQTRPLALFLGVVVLLTLFEQAILSSIVVARDLRGVVPSARSMLVIGTLRRGLLGVCGMVELLVAGVVLVGAVAVADLDSLVRDDASYGNGRASWCAVARSSGFRRVTATGSVRPSQEPDPD